MRAAGLESPCMSVNARVFVRSAADWLRAAAEELTPAPPSAASEAGPPPPPPPPPPEPAGEGAAEAEGLTRGPPSPGAQGCHVYVVWSTDVPAGVTGVHVGGARCWQFLLERVSWVHVRRAEDLATGRRLYEAEAERHGAPPVAAVWLH